MKYPKLVPPRLCHTEVKVSFLGDLDIEGDEEILGEFSGKCNIQFKTKQRLTADKRLVTINAVALFDGDIAPDISNPKGTLKLKKDGSADEYDKEYRIHSIAKECNPDGSVNYTRVELTE